MKTLLKSRQTIIILASFAVMVLFLSGCAQKEIIDTCLTGKTYGFWDGLWHGIIAPIDFIVSLFKDNIVVYATNNNGAWYAFGFLIGSGGWGFFGGNKAAKSMKRPEKCHE